MNRKVSLRCRQANRLRVLKFGAIALVALFAALFGTVAVSGAKSHDAPAAALSASPLLAIGGLMFRDKPDEGGGSSTQNAAPAWAPPATMPEPVGDTGEAKLTSAASHIKTFFTNLGLAYAAFTKLQGDYKTLETQFNELKQTAQTAQNDLATQKGEVTRLTTELGTANNDLAREKGNVNRLESLCQLKGIDANAVVPPATVVPAALETADDWNKKLAAAKTTEEQHKILADFQKAAHEGKVKKA